MRSILCAVLGLLPCVAAAAQSRPNIIVILSDDMGFSDLGCYGGEIETAHLDQLAEHGLRFTQFYNTARCWPTRGALMTGYYAQQIHRDALPGVGGGGQGVRQDWARLLPNFLKPAGYRSYHSGKWHIDGKVLDGGAIPMLEAEAVVRDPVADGEDLHRRSHRLLERAACGVAGRTRGAS